MKPSDWVAIVALGASFGISLATFYFNYKINQANINARRDDLVTEKSIEAFRVVSEKLTTLMDLASGEEAIAKASAVEEMNNALDEYGFFFPLDLYDEIVGISSVLSEHKVLVESKTDVLDAAYKGGIRGNVRELITRMQTHLGVLTEVRGGDIVSFLAHRKPLDGRGKGGMSNLP